MEIDGKRLKARREAQGLSQQALAARAGVSQATIAKLELGTTRGRARDQQDRLALALQTTTEEICGPSTGSEPPLPGRPAAELTVVRDEPPPIIDPEDTESPLEAALNKAYDSSRHILRDADAVRKAIRSRYWHQRTDIDLIPHARRLLDVAAQLRREGGKVTEGEILARIMLPNRPQAMDLERAEQEDADALEEQKRELGPGEEFGMYSERRKQLDEAATKRERLRGAVEPQPVKPEGKPKK